MSFRDVKVIDVQVDEAKRLAILQREISEKFAGSPKDILVWARMRDELTYRAAELGFNVELSLETDSEGNWLPICNIVGRTDKKLERILAEEGPDLERKAYDAQRVTSSELERQGVDTSLLG